MHQSFPSLFQSHLLTLNNPNPGTHKTLILYFCPVIDIYISVWTCFHEAFCLPYLEFNLPAPYLQCPGFWMVAHIEQSWDGSLMIARTKLTCVIVLKTYLFCVIGQLSGKNMLSNTVRYCNLFIYLALKYVMSVKEQQLLSKWRYSDTLF